MTYDPITHYPMWQKLHSIITHQPETFEMDTWGSWIIGPNGKSQSLHTLSIYSEETLESQVETIEKCDTIHCLAGHVAALEGYHPTINHERLLTWNRVNPAQALSDLDAQSEDIEDVGARGMGLDMEQAYQLFHTLDGPAAEIVGLVAGGSMSPQKAMDYVAQNYDDGYLPQL